LPFAIWVLRNYLQTNTFLNEYDSAAIPFMLNLEESATLVWKYFAPDVFITHFFKIIFLFIILIFLAYFSVKGKKEIQFLSTQALAFFMFLLVSNTLKTIFRYDDRYLLPFYFLLMLLSFIAIGKISEMPKIRSAVIFGSVFLMLYTLSRTINNYRNWYANAAGYTAAFEERKSVVDAIEPNLDYYSNDAAKIIAYTNKKCYYISEKIVSELAIENTIQLIWFNKIDYDYSISLEEILKNFRVVTKNENNEYTIYTLKAI
jgi:hypothetical protein